MRCVRAMIRLSGSAIGVSGETPVFQSGSEPFRPSAGMARLAIRPKPSPRDPYEEDVSGVYKLRTSLHPRSGMWYNTRHGKESHTRAAGRGLWANPAPVNPYEWRKSRR